MSIVVGFPESKPHAYEDATASVHEGALRIETSEYSVTYASGAWSLYGEGHNSKAVIKWWGSAVIAGQTLSDE
jgi:hypothetical protein